MAVGPVCGLTSQGTCRAGRPSQARPASPDNDPRVKRYAQRILERLGEAEPSLPAKERETFWRDSVEGDPALLQRVRTYDR